MSPSEEQQRRLYERLVGKKVAGGRYVITKLLGFGGMSGVFEAVQRNMDRRVAIKLIPTHDATIVARFQREALTVSKLHHPNTVTVFDHGRADSGALYLAMELLSGQPLSAAIEAGPLPADRAVHIAAQICRSLGEAHGHGIVHRDIKPENIFLIEVDRDRDFVKVLDFGIAKVIRGEDGEEEEIRLTTDGRVVGTPQYMSPEQIMSDSLDPRSDIYSVGCVIYEMLCGAPPFESENPTVLMLNHTEDPPPCFAERLDGRRAAAIPAGLEAVVRKALAKEPEERFQDIDALRVALEGAMSGRMGRDPSQGVVAMPPSVAAPGGMTTGPFFAGPVAPRLAKPSKPSKPSKRAMRAIASRRRSVIAVLGIVVLLCFMAAAIVYGGSDEARAPRSTDAAAMEANPRTMSEPVKAGVGDLPRERRMEAP